MKVKIGKPKKWIGSYQIAEFICFWERWLPDTEEDRLSDKLGNLLACGNLKGEGENTWFQNWLEKRHREKKEKIYVKVEDHDTWDLDYTLALIILPSLKKLKEDKLSMALVDDCDVPDSLIPETEDNFEDRWDYVLDRMIWSFEQVVNMYEEGFDKNLDKKDFKGYFKDVDEGLILFGKYYRDLWS